jgi:hypothetical protein
MLKGAAKGWSSGVQVLAAIDQHYWAITPTRAQPDIDVGVLTAQTPFEVDMMSDGRLVVQAAGCQG